MRDLERLLQELTCGGAEIWVDSQKLRIRAPEALLRKEITTVFGERKQEILTSFHEIRFSLSQSPGQEALWLIQRSNPSSAAYNVGYALRVESHSDPKAKFEAALQRLINRHMLLRSRFPAVDGEPTWQIWLSQSVNLVEVDLTGSTDNAVSDELSRLHLQPFDLEGDAPLRTHWLRIGPKTHILSLCFHHIAVDGWSMRLLIDELLALLSAEKGTNPLLPLEGTFARHVEARLCHLKDSGDALGRYWREALMGVPHVLKLPTDQPRPPRQTFVGASHRFELGFNQLEGLRRLARRGDATLYAVLLAGFQVLLHRLSGQETLCIGTPTAGRDDQKDSDAFGYMVNPIVLASSLSLEDPPSFLSFLTNTRDSLLRGLRHADYPFSWVARDLARERDGSRSPIFQVMLSHQRIQDLDDEAIALLEGRVVELAGLRLSAVPLPTKTAEMDLVLEVEERGGVAEMMFRYNTALFEPETMARWAGHLQVLLAAAVADPTLPVTRLPLLSPAERHTILHDWCGLSQSLAITPAQGRLANNPTGTPARSVVERIREQITASPEAAAIVHGAEVLSYADLGSRAGRLAVGLQRLGARPGVRVAVAMDRTPTLIVALLAVLASGAAYVPIDPRYPLDRRRLMLEDSGATVLLSTGLDEDGLLSQSPEGLRVIDIEREEEAIASEDGALPAAGRPEDAAYMLFTSGSTGRPKAVIIEHRNLAAFLDWGQEAFSQDDLRGTLASTSICFDISVFEIFLPLCLGGRLILAEDALALPRLPARDQVTLINTVPSAMAELVRSAELPPSVRVVNLAGEKLSGDLVRRVWQRSSIERLHNLYGPTETTIYATCCLVPQDISEEPSIGRPISGTTTTILDRDLQPVPPGVAGELYIGGAGVGRGYHQRPDLTAERFIPNPFGAGRLYRTGDLARFRADGSIDYLGRIDQQIKLRGFRIEFGEIEAALERLPAVDRAVVVLRGLPENQRLIAYWSPLDEANATDTELRSALLNELPRFMVPESFMRLDALPLNSSGKIDRGRLPEPQQPSFESAAGLAPETPTERTLAALWSELLERNEIGAADDFFALGGHSLIAARLMARLQVLHGVDLPLRTVFDHSSLAALARHIETLTPLSRDRGPLPALTAQPHGGELPLSLPQRRLWFLSQLPGANLAYTMPIVVELTGPLPVEALTTSFNALITRHESLRTGFRLGEEGPLQVIHPPRPFALDQRDLRDVDGEAPRQDVIREVEALLHEPFDLSQPPLLRVHLLRVAEDRHLLVLLIHHIVADGWSLGVLERELSALYTAALRGEPSPLPPLPVQYADFSRWQAERARGSKAIEDLAFWRLTLADLPPLDLPTDRPRPAVESFQGEHHLFTIDRSLSEALRELARAESTTLYGVLLAGFNLLLRCYADGEDIAVASGNANRDHPHLEGLIGFFVDTWIVRVDLSGAPSVRELLRRVREAHLAATDHQELPFERIVEELRPERSLSRNPLTPVGLTLQSWQSEGFQLPQLRVRQDHFRFTTAKLDLLLMISEGEQGLDVVFEYNTDLYEAETIRRMSTHLLRILGELTEDPCRPISAIDPLSPEERDDILERCAGADAPFSSHRCIHHLFEDWADRSPDSLAIVDHCVAAVGRVEITYGELERQANTLAAHLRQRGVGPERVVGLFLNRSARQIIAILAVLKAGGAFLTLDPDHPDDRLRLMVEDSDLALVLSESEVRPLAGGERLTRIELDGLLVTPQNEWQGQGEGKRLAVPQHSGDLAYVVYTSGSTGTPNGVQVEHRSLVNSIESDIRLFDTGPGCSFPHLTSFNFDAALSHLLMMLCAGGTIHLLPRGGDVLGDALVECLRAEGITHAVMPTAMLNALPEVRLPNLRVVGAGGDVVTPELVDRWGLDRRFFNVYGPTEVTITATVAQCVADGRPIPIGRPIANLRAYVLDREGRLTPAGVPGELHLGGVGVARGYQRRPELNAAKFIANPFGPGRLYRTGDRVRWRMDGAEPPQLEFLGRIDQQVKIRGHRIELSEVEHVLRSLPRVREAVVTTDGSASGKRLLAYVSERIQGRDGERERERVAQWERLHGESLASAAGDDPTLDLRGWSSSFTGAPIPAEEMQLWVEDTVDRILTLQPREVLEIGCGTGMLLSRIAPRVARYHGCDLSEHAVAHIQRLKARFPDLAGVTAAHAPAHQARDNAGRYDTVVLNSVVQYFPSASYLEDVLTGVLAGLEGPGALFIGDVRNHALFRMFHCAVASTRAGERPAREDLRRRTEQGMANENELLVHPSFFLAFAAAAPRVTSVEIHVKPGSYRNELSLFRYDVVMGIDGARPSEPAVPWLDWREAKGTLVGLREAILAARERGEEVELAYTDVPNARLLQAEALERWAFGEGVPEPEDGALPSAVDPEALHRLAAELGVSVRLSWARGDARGAFDLWIGGGEASAVRMPAPGDLVTTTTNNPLQGASQKRLIAEIRDQLKARLPAHMVPSTITVLPALPLTINGKVDLRRLPAPAPESAAEVEERAPESSTELALAEIWCELLGLERVGLADNFFELGGDSIIAVQVVARARGRGLTLRASQLFEQQTLAELAAVATVGPAATQSAAELAGPVPLSPIQHWFFDHPRPHPAHFNQAVLLHVPADVKDSALALALGAVVRQHGALRHRFQPGTDGWKQLCLPADAVIEGCPLVTVDLSTLEAPRVRSALADHGSRLQASLDLVEGPVTRAALFRTPDGGRLLWAVHHLVVDALSWRVLLEDLETAYGQASRGEEPVLPAPTTSFGHWCLLLAQRGAELDVSAERRLLEGPVPAPLPVDHPEARNDRADAAVCRVALDQDSTRALFGEGLRAYRLRPQELLLTALARTLREWTGASAHWLDLEGHGREDLFADAGVDLSRSVGWFTSLFPLRLELPPEAEPGAELLAVKEQLRAIPRRGAGFGLLRQRHPEGADLAWPQPEISFNFLGRAPGGLGGSLLRGFAEEPIGPSEAEEGPRTHLLAINAGERDGRLELALEYSAALHDSATVQALAEGILRTIRALLAHSLEPGAGALSPSDAPLVPLDGAALDGIARRLGGAAEVEAIYPLTGLQRGLLARVLYGDATDAYGTHIALTLHGDLDTALLRRVWRQLVERHDMLRSCFLWEGLPQPVQVVHREAEIPWEELDPAGESPAETPVDLFTALPVALDRAPVGRVRLTRMAEGRHTFAFHSHHVLLDGWSMFVVVRDMMELYRAQAQGREPRLPRVGSHASHASRLAAVDLEASRRFWQRDLAGFEEPTPLPEERDAAAGGSGFRRESLRLDVGVTARLVAVAERERITLASLVEGLWALVLARHADRDEVLFGGVVSGRDTDLPGIEHMAGLFIHTLPVRVPIDEEQDLWSWLRAHQSRQAERREHQHLPLAEIQRCAAVPPGGELFRCLVAVENYPIDEEIFAAEGLRVAFHSASSPTHYPLVVSALPGTRLELNLDYDACRFTAAAMGRLSSQLERLVDQVLATPTPRLEALTLSAGTVQADLLRWADGGRATTPPGETLHGLFEAWVDHDPDAQAVIVPALAKGSRVVLSYRELEERANRLAHALIDRGVTRGDRVALQLPRGLEVVVALLGVLKAGAAFVVLDPELPGERLRAMVADAMPACLIVNSTPHPGEMPAEIPWITLEDALSSTANQRPGLALTDDALAYVLFTSGTTGLPNGVLVEHRGIANVVATAATLLRLGPGSRFANPLSLNFDGGLSNLFTALAAGATAVLVPREGDFLGAGFVAMADHEAVTHLLLVPSMLAALPEATLPELSDLIVAGEACPPELVERWGPGRRFWNFYGPTEVSVWATYARCEPGAGMPPIGRPIPGASVHVVDRCGRLAPPGAAGELWIAGVGVARGYLNRTELTDRKFLPNPFGEGRIYRTGDLVRFRLKDDGAAPTLDFLGRIDQQVKIGGHRIELGEIEAQLRACDGVRDAAVSVHGEGRSRRLVAYTVPTEPGASLDPSRLRDVLRQRLPEALVPSTFLSLEALPLTVNGKLDRRGLPEPPSGGDQSPVEPRNAIEQVLRDIWKSSLRREGIGIHDNFFELGGDSISAIQIVSQVQALGYTLKASQVFDHQTIASLAEVVGVSANAAEQGLVSGAVPLTPIQRWFFALDLSNPSHFNQAVLLEAPASLRLEVLRTAMHAVCHHHDMLRARYTASGSLWTQTISAAVEGPPIEEHDLSGLASDGVATAIQAETTRLQASLDISAGPLTRLAMFRLGEERPARLFWVIHHLAVDAVSWSVLIADLARACEQAEAGEPVTLPAKTTSFQRWAEHLVDFAARDPFTAERASLATRVPAPLPCDRAGAANRLEFLGEHRVRLAASATAAMLEQALRPYNVGVQEVLLAALAEALHDWTGHPELWIDVEGHGREAVVGDVDVSRTVGWFTTLFPLRLPLAASDAIERLILVKEALRGVPRRGVGYGLLRHLHGEGERIAWPETEISFNYLGQVREPVDAALDLRRAKEAIGPSQAGQGERPHLLAINARIVDASLTISLAYSRAHHDGATIEALAAALLRSLETLIARCGAPGAGAVTPTDFPLVNLSRPQLASVLRQVEAAGNDVEAIYPLIAVQPALLRETLASGSIGMWRTQVVLEIKGALDPDRLRDAWRRVLRGQPLLRSCFAWSDLAEPVQVVRRALDVPWQQIDGSELGDGPEALRRLCVRWAEEELPLNRAPLMRLRLLPWADDRHTLVFDAHHLLADGWSLGVILRDLATALVDQRRGRENRAANPGVYERYLRWRADLDLEPSRQFWARTLAGLECPTPLPAEALEVGSKTAEGHGHATFDLNVAATARIRAAAEAARVTAATLLDAAWALLLQRHSGRADVVFGMTVSGRDVPVPGVETLVGHFIDFLPLRLRAPGEGEVLSWLREVQTVRNEAIHHQHLGLREIQGCAGVPIEQPLFRSFVVFENYPLELNLFEATGLTVTMRSGASHASHFPLAVGAMPKGDRLTLFLNYDRQRFEEGAMTKLSEELRRTLEELCLACETSHRDSEVQSDENRQARAFTVSWDDPREAEEMWMLDQIHCPSPLRRLDYELRLRTFIVATNRSNQRFGLPLHSEPKLIHGFVYNKIVMDDLEPSTLPEVLQACDDNVRRGYAELKRSWEEAWLPAIEGHLAALNGFDLAGASLPALCRHLGAVQKRVEALWEIHNDLLVPLLLALHDFEEAFRDLFPEAGPLAAFDLLGGLPNKTTETNQNLWNLGRQAARNPLLAATLTGNPVDQLRERLAETQQGQELWAELESFLQVYGERNDDLFLDQPTWIEDPAPVLRGLREAVLQPKRDLAGDFTHHASLREEKVAGVRKVLAALPAAVSAEFEHLLGAAQAATVLSEDHHFWIDCKITHHARRVALELGRRLRAMGLLEARDDVFHLGVNELVALADSSPDPREWRTRVASRQAAWENHSGIEAPLMLGVPRPLLPMDCAMLKVSTKFSGNLFQAPATPGGGLEGMPASSGTVVGPARILRSLEEADKLRPGDILVTAFTLPSWTPFFASVKGVVTNTGGILCHAAVVAREYRIPAVVGTVRATERFRDGDLIEVDGDAGTVRRVVEGETPHTPLPSPI
ncbi:MAG: amino acid adenylation domain-containing protein [Cyanobacteriota bacterium]|nr:amino acid adenylation domain-containing protein [Cyanobacteriota bacterium]